MSDDVKNCAKCNKPLEGKEKDGLHPACRNGKRQQGKHAGLSDKIVKAEAVKADGSPTKMAKALGVTPQTAQHHLQKPKIQNAIMAARKRALKAAGITREKAYGRIADGMNANVVAIYEGWAAESNAPDYKERREATKLALQLLGDLDKDGEGNEGAVIINMPSIFIDNVEVKFDVGEIIDVLPAATEEDHDAEI